MKKVNPLLSLLVAPFVGCIGENTPSPVEDGRKIQHDVAFIGVDPGEFYPAPPDSISPEVDSLSLAAEEVAKPRPLEKIAAAAQVTLCAAINYGGTCWTMNAGEKIDYNDLRIINPLGNDVISSGYTTGGAVIYLCDAINWGGPCYAMSGYVPDFRSFPINGSVFNYNDRVSSFKFDLVSNGNYIKAYDPPYGGDGSQQPCKLFAPFDYNYMPCDFNDKTSSQYPVVDLNVIPRYGWFYKGGSFTLEGYYSRWNSPVLDPSHFNNTFSSFKWENF